MAHSRGRSGGFRVLVATDGSAAARAAMDTACVLPWPPGTRVRGVIATPPEWTGGQPAYVRMALVTALERAARAARRRLGRRWPDAEMILTERPAIDAIVDAARRFGASVIVVGWRGHGAVRRALMGSVSRGVVERAACPVLVVRRRRGTLRRVVIGLDGSPNAHRAVDFAARLGRAGLSITVVRVVEPIALPTAGLLPGSVRATLLHNAAMLNRQLLRRARRDVDAAASRLRRQGWTVRTAARTGAPLATLLDVVNRTRGDLLIVGARGARGLRRVLLGSVAAGALNRCPVPVLVVR
jgi:nucleotide-binding universal stress UspA family protein